MKKQSMILVLGFLILSTASLSAQSSPPLTLNYAWTKVKPKPTLQTEIGNSALFPKDQKSKLSPYQQENDQPMGTAKDDQRFTLRIAVPDTDKVVKMPMMKIDTSMHYHIRWKDLE